MKPPVRRTKILATIGPATDSPRRIAQLVRAGTDAFRLNFSHGTDAEHRSTLRRLRGARGLRGRELAIVADVQGPKIRIGDLTGGRVTLRTGQSWVLDQRSPAGNSTRVGVSIPGFSQAAERGDPVILGDGNVVLEVRSADAQSITTRVTAGGVVTSHAGLFLPRAHLRTSVLGPKDRRDARIAVEEGADFLALSFVRSGEDLAATRHWLDRIPNGDRLGLIAKLERAEALTNIDGILDRADGVMVARGDLGIEVPLERLALEQKALLRKANTAGRFAIVATQMLLSMLHAPRPTRAEATDVANAVLDGADAVMLSEESAVGDYPIEAVEWLGRIAAATEQAYDPWPIRVRAAEGETSGSAERAVASAAVQLAEAAHAAAIVTPTHSGRTARLVAALRPACPIVALSGHAPVRRKLALVGGVSAVRSPEHLTLVEMRRQAPALARAAGVEGVGPLVLTAGYPIEGRPTNLVTVVERNPSGTR